MGKPVVNLGQPGSTWFNLGQLRSTWVNQHHPTLDESDAQVGRRHAAAGLDRDVRPLLDVVDVRWNRRVRSNAVFLHQADQFRLGQVRWRRRVVVAQLETISKL